MIGQPELSPEEWALIVELLERERGELPSELRHTRLASMREDLRHRAKMVEQLLKRLRAAAPA